MRGGAFAQTRSRFVIPIRIDQLLIIKTAKIPRRNGGFLLSAFVFDQVAHAASRGR